MIQDPDLKGQLELARRENMAIQEMLAYVLKAHGEPVAINKEELTGGTFDGYYIDIQDDIAKEQFVISLREVKKSDDI